MEITSKTLCGDTTIGHVARMHVGELANYPVEIIPGDSEPTTRGSGWHSSTFRITVGEEWCKALIKDRVRQHKANGVTCYIRCGSRKIIHGIQASQGWNKHGQMMLVESGDRVYHSSEVSYNKAIKTTIKAWVSASRELRRFAKGLGKSLEEIEITKGDSYAAGNCKIGTEMFIQRHRELLGKETILASEFLTIGQMDSINRVKATIAVAASRQQ